MKGRKVFFFTGVAELDKNLCTGSQRTITWAAVPKNRAEAEKRKTKDEVSQTQVLVTLLPLVDLSMPEANPNLNFQSAKVINTCSPWQML